MTLRDRPMQPKDIDECVEMIAMHPVVGPRYGSAISELREAWLRLLQYQSRTCVLIEEVSGPRPSICFVGVTVFVSDDFLREMKAHPLFWFGAELARRLTRGESPLLTDKQICEANSREGLNLLVWEGCFRPEFENRNELHRKMMSLFIDEHRGFLLKEVIAAPMESVARLQWTLRTGGFLWDSERGCYQDSLGEDAHEVISKPHVVGVTRALDRRILGSWVGLLFDYHPPRLGFSPGEQRLLLSALQHATDEELRDHLGASASTVKSTWRSIYNRAASRLPELFPDAPASGQSSERGKEKRRRLLAYLAEHPEELRPVSRRLLQRVGVIG